MWEERKHGNAKRTCGTRLGGTWEGRTQAWPSQTHLRHQACGIREGNASLATRTYLGSIRDSSTIMTLYCSLETLTWIYEPQLSFCFSLLLLLPVFLSCFFCPGPRLVLMFWESGWG